MLLTRRRWLGWATPYFLCLFLRVYPSSIPPHSPSNLSSDTLGYFFKFRLHSVSLFFLFSLLFLISHERKIIFPRLNNLWETTNLTPVFPSLLFYPLTSLVSLFWWTLFTAARSCIVAIFLQIFQFSYLRTLENSCKLRNELIFSDAAPFPFSNCF